MTYEERYKNGQNIKLWHNNYDDLCAYLSKKNCGICDIPDNAVNRNGKSLKRWVYEMKKACDGKSKYKLTEEQIGLLKDIGIDKLLSVTETVWYAHFNDLLRFYNENHHLNISRSVLCSDGTKLLLWTRQQRGKYQKHTLSERYVNEFRRHDLMEVLETPLDTAMRHVEEYYKEHGNIDFYTSYVYPDGYKLGVWLRTLRDKYLNNKNKKPYPQEVIDRLNEMGIVWSKMESRWNMSYQTCKDYLDTHNGYSLPADLTTDDGTLIKNWLTNNKKLYRQGKLPDDRAKLLEAIHILEITIYEPVYSPEDSDIFKTADGKLWLANYKKCKVFLDKNGGDNLPIDMLTVNGRPMNKWLYVNRRRYKNGDLPKEKQELLDMINIEKLRFRSMDKLKKRKEIVKRSRYSKTINIKMTDAEYAKIKKEKKNSGHSSMSEYVRYRLFGKTN